MDPFLVHGQGLVFDGTLVKTPAAARAAAADWLVEHGADEWDVEAGTEQAPVARAWWGGDDLGFVQKQHESAQVVVVVQLDPELYVGEEVRGGPRPEEPAPVSDEPVLPKPEPVAEMPG